MDAHDSLRSLHWKATSSKYNSQCVCWLYRWPPTFAKRIRSTVHFFQPPLWIAWKCCFRFMPWRFWNVLQVQQIKRTCTPAGNLVHRFLCGDNRQLLLPPQIICPPQRFWGDSKRGAKSEPSWIDRQDAYDTQDNKERSGNTMKWWTITNR